MFQQRNSVSVARKITQSDRVVIRFKEAFTTTEIVVKDADDKIRPEDLQRFLESPGAIRMPEFGTAFKIVGMDKMRSARGLKRTVDVAATPWFMPGGEPRKLPPDPRERDENPNQLYVVSRSGPGVPIEKDAVVIPMSAVTWDSGVGVDQDALDDLLSESAERAHEIER